MVNCVLSYRLLHTRHDRHHCQRTDVTDVGGHSPSYCGIGTFIEIEAIFSVSPLVLVGCFMFPGGLSSCQTGHMSCAFVYTGLAIWSSLSFNLTDSNFSVSLSRPSNVLNLSCSTTSTFSTIEVHYKIRSF